MEILRNFSVNIELVGIETLASDDDRGGSKVLLDEVSNILYLLFAHIRCAVDIRRLNLVSKRK